MPDHSPSQKVSFTLNGTRYELLRSTVDDRLRGVPPEPVRTHGVCINDTWYPVKQAFEAATGVPRSEFISHAARRYLEALGYEVGGQIESRTPPPQGRTGSRPVPRPGPGPTVAAHVDESWHTEANVQATLVTALAAAGWRILAVANTATKEHGIDVIASRGDEHVGVEVKGFPSRGYADPARAGEVKRTAPSTQAGHWYAQAVLAAMRLRTKRPDLRSVIALPDFPRYRDLYDETRGSLDAAGIAMWWVRADGRLEQ